MLAVINTLFEFGFRARECCGLHHRPGQDEWRRPCSEQSLSGGNNCRHENHDIYRRVTLNVDDDARKPILSVSGHDS